MPAVKLERVRYYGHAKAGILTLFMEMLWKNVDLRFQFREFASLTA
jgi:hypothetical protein